MIAGKENETIHVVWTDQDRKRKRENKGPKPQTRFTLNCDSPEAFADLYGRLGPHHAPGEEQKHRDNNSD